ncbi:MAG: MarR family transcriptional regulator [Xanthobacteraceae bacterium]|nr:MAG: MarR family transcriptional regulator [Xanthobacteraceae bacterium]
MTEKFRAAGVTLTELRLLATIGKHQPLAVNEASSLTGIDKAWVSRSLTTLAASLRQPGRPLALTPQGKTKVQRIIPLAVERNERLLAGKRNRAIFDKTLDEPQGQIGKLNEP